MGDVIVNEHQYIDKAGKRVTKLDFLDRNGQVLKTEIHIEDEGLETIMIMNTRHREELLSFFKGMFSCFRTSLGREVPEQCVQVAYSYLTEGLTQSELEVIEFSIDAISRACHHAIMRAVNNYYLEGREV